MTVTQFLNEYYVDYASYSTLRMIGSAIDGLKNSSRKIVCTTLDKNIKTETKLFPQYASKVAEHTGAIVTLAQNYAGTNNIPLLVREGNFGTRFNQEASAPRYIQSYGSKELFDMFNNDDSDILIQQEFEGQRIEPVFYVPSLPILLINGSLGVSTGFKQEILPRNPEKIKKYLTNRLNGKQTRGDVFTPWFNGFEGEIVQGETSRQWIIKGIVKRINASKVEITEVPIGYDLKGYLKVLDDLEEQGVIKSYNDKSDDKKSKFRFEVSFAIKDLRDMTDDELLEKLKLIKKTSEIYTCVDEHNRIVVFDNAQEIFDYYFDIKMKYLKIRKEHLLKKMDFDIDVLMSKHRFIEAVVSEKIKVAKKKKDDIIKQIEKHGQIIKVDDSYDYLLKMPIHSLTSEKMEELSVKIKETLKESQVLEEITLERMWENDIS